MSVFIVTTPHGPVTSYRKVWENDLGQDVYAWRTDGERAVHWATHDSAQEWIDQVFRETSTEAEREDKASFKVVQA